MSIISDCNFYHFIISLVLNVRVQDRDYGHQVSYPNYLDSTAMNPFGNCPLNKVTIVTYRNDVKSAIFQKGFSKMEELEEFDEPRSQHSHYCQRISNQTFEKQRIEHTKEELNNLKKRMDGDTYRKQLYHVIRKKKLKT